jgi:hypothetical protein
MQVIVIQKGKEYQLKIAAMGMGIDQSKGSASDSASE